MTAGFQRIERQIVNQITRLDDRLKVVEMFQNDQKRRFNERRLKWKQNTQADGQQRPHAKPNQYRKPVNSGNSATPKRQNGASKSSNRRHGPCPHE